MPSTVASTCGENGRSCLSMTDQDAAMGAMGGGDGCQRAEAEADSHQSLGYDFPLVCTS